MEQIFYVTDDDLREVNNWLQKGGKVKMIVTCPASDSIYRSIAYVVIEFD